MMKVKVIAPDKTELLIDESFVKRLLDCGYTLAKPPKKPTAPKKKKTES